MKPVNIGGHAAYRNALRDCLHACYPNLSVITKSQWKIYEKFRDLDLSAIDSIMEDKYSVFGPEPRPPSCMFRSYLLSLASDFPFVTAWVDAIFLDEQPYATLFAIFQACFLNQSVLRGVIHTENLTLSGDGTPVVTAARERGHKICDCASKGVFRCSCPRFFSQPDCDIGWDSSRNLY